MPYKTLIGRRPMSAFFKNYPEWGVGRSRPLLRALENESVKVARLEFLKRTHGREFIGFRKTPLLANLFS